MYDVFIIKIPIMHMDGGQTQVFAARCKSGANKRAKGEKLGEKKMKGYRPTCSET